MGAFFGNRIVTLCKMLKKETEAETMGPEGDLLMGPDGVVSATCLLSGVSW